MTWVDLIRLCSGWERRVCKMRVDCAWDIQPGEMIRSPPNRFSVRQWIFLCITSIQNAIFLMPHSFMMTKMLIRWLP
jgi:hypothetical protein